MEATQAPDAAAPAAAEAAAATAAQPSPPTFSLSRFESACYARQHEPAARDFVTLLQMLDRNYGALDGGFSAEPTANIGDLDRDSHVINRICAALSALFTDPAFNLTFDGFRHMLYLHRWIATLFAASAFRNADHILRSLNVNGADHPQVELKLEHLGKFCLLFTPNSEIPLNLDALWAYDKNLTVALGCSLLSPRFLGTASAHHKREVLLQWLPEKLDEIEDLDALPVAILQDVYMHCSYAYLPSKHAIKGSINRLIRRKLLQQQILDVPDEPERRLDREKPVMLVVLEWFSGGHSIFRTHSASLNAARSSFRLVGVANATTIDPIGKSVFDEFLEVEGDAVLFIRAAAERLRPDVVYYPAFGMFPHTIFLTNLRLAPVQVVSYGHPATSMSPFIDYFVLPTDWVGDPECFSEKMLALPKPAMPFVPSFASYQANPTLRNRPEEIRIAVASTTMKLNPRFMAALHRIRAESVRPIRFHFFIGSLRGLVYMEVRQFILSYLPDATIYTHLPYDQYMRQMSECDMYVNPFPFGNTNGIVDVTALGLVGVCRTGPEVLEHIDEALFGRLDLPDWLVTRTDDEYVRAAVRLANEDDARLALRRRLLSSTAVRTFYQGKPEIFGQRLRELSDALGRRTARTTA